MPIHALRESNAQWEVQAALQAGAFHLGGRQTAEGAAWRWENDQVTSRGSLTSLSAKHFENDCNYHKHLLHVYPSGASSLGRSIA